MPTPPADRPFPSFQRGELRELRLSVLRNAFRAATNPDTGQPFTEGEIAVVTSELGRDWADSESLDLVLTVLQQRGIFLFDQQTPLTSTDETLRRVWGPLASPSGGSDFLPASSGGGVVTAPAPEGTVFVGSVTRPDSAAHKIRIGSVTYQVLYTEQADSTGFATLRVRALTTGRETNALAGSKVSAVSWPHGANASLVDVPDDFRGGAARETAAAFARRIMIALRDKQGAGNPAELRGWALGASAAVEDAWIYCNALEAGSTVVAITAKREGSTSPTARIPGADTVEDLVRYAVPPGSPVVPGAPWIAGLGAVSEPTDVSIKLKLPNRSTSGWADLIPWPAMSAAPAQVTSITTQQNFKIDVGAAGAPASSTPALMIWRWETMSFELLAVSSVALDVGTIYTVQLSTPPVATVAVGSALSPATNQSRAIAGAAIAYMDSLGLGELVDLLTSPLASRAFRQPTEDEEWPASVGNAFLSFVRDAIGAAATAADLSYVSTATPTVPADPIDGPNLLTLRHFGVYPL